MPNGSLRGGFAGSLPVVCALFAANVVCLAAGTVALKGDSLVLDGRPFLVRGVAYHGAPLGERPRSVMPSLPCLYARDLPLMTAMGANVVRTPALLPESDQTFTAMLESAGLYWLAGFPLEPFYNPEQPITAQRQRILDAFRNYVSRFRGKPRVMGYVFGDDVALDYSTKFAGSPGDFYSLLADAAAILREASPGSAPLLTTSVSAAQEMSRRVDGLSFWSWSAGSITAASVEEATHAASRPVLVAGFAADDGTAASVSRQASAMHGVKRLLGAVYADFSGGTPAAFSARPARVAGLDTLTPQPVFYALTSEWGGRYPATWAEKSAPRLNSSEEDSPSPGSLIRLEGTALLHPGAPYSDEAWPLHLGTVCLCVGGSPARLSLVSPAQVSAQIPFGVEPGEQGAILFRGGVASNPLPLRITQFSAGTLTGPVLEARLNVRQ